MDCENLILEIEKHTCLYDLGNEKYKDRNAKLLAWLTVSEAVVGDERWKQMETEEKNKYLYLEFYHWLQTEDNGMNLSTFYSSQRTYLDAA